MTIDLCTLFPIQAVMHFTSRVTVTGLRLFSATCGLSPACRSAYGTQAGCRSFLSAMLRLWAEVAIRYTACVYSKVIGNQKIQYFSVTDPNINE
jgi:hypothetical protein